MDLKIGNNCKTNNAIRKESVEKQQCDPCNFDGYNT